MATMGKRLLTCRRARRWSQSKLASRLGVSKALVGHWENDRRMPGARRLKRLARLLQTTVGEIYGERAA